VAEARALKRLLAVAGVAQLALHDPVVFETETAPVIAV